MRILNDTPFAIAPFVGKMRPPVDSVTLIVKATYRLRPDDTVVPDEEQLFPTGDEFADDDDSRGLRYTSDFVYFKPMADLLLVGHCHAPGEQPVPSCPVAFRVGDHHRSLLVHGNRHWLGGFGIKVATDPEPFTSMDIGWANAFGGPKNKWNRAGKGTVAVTLEDGSRVVPLPNVESVENRVVSKLTRPMPAGFGPVEMGWKPRTSKLGTYRRKWLKERWPWFPEDFDWAYFNSAPEPMQREGYLRGDEELCFEGLHPELSVYRSRLAGHRVRCLLDEKKDGGGTALREVKMNLDTLWVDMEAERLVLVWRGIAEVQSDEMNEVENVLIFQEPLGERPRSLEGCIELRDKLLGEAAGKKPPPADEEPVEEAMAKEEAALRAQLEEQGIDMEKLEEEARKRDPEEDRALVEKFAREQGIWEDVKDFFAPPNTAEIVLARFAKGETFEEEDLEGLDLSGRKLAGIVLRGAELTGADLSGADLTGADLEGAVLRNANLAGVKLDGANLSRAYLSGCRMQAASLEGAKLDKTVLVGADLTGARLLGAKGASVDLSRAKLDEAILEKVAFEGSQLGEASLKGARLAESALVDCDLSGCAADGADFSRADLRGARFTRGARLPGASFREARAAGSNWEGAELEGADFSLAQLSGADFSKANLRGAVFSRARARKARFEKSDLRGAKLLETDVFQGSFEKADLTEADLRGANLYEVEFLDAVLEKTNLEFANVRMTKLA